MTHSQTHILAFETGTTKPNCKTECKCVRIWIQDEKSPLHIVVIVRVITAQLHCCRVNKASINKICCARHLPLTGGFPAVCCQLQPRFGAGMWEMLAGNMCAKQSRHQNIEQTTPRPHSHNPYIHNSFTFCSWIYSFFSFYFIYTYIVIYPPSTF